MCGRLRPIPVFKSGADVPNVGWVDNQMWLKARGRKRKISGAAGDIEDLHSRSQIQALDEILSPARSGLCNFVQKSPAIQVARDLAFNVSYSGVIPTPSTFHTLSSV